MLVGQFGEENTAVCSVGPEMEPRVGATTLSGRKHSVVALTWRNPYQIERDELFASARSGKPTNQRALHGAKHDDRDHGTDGDLHRQEDRVGGQARNAGHIFGSAECDFSTELPVKPRPDGTYPVRIPGVNRLVS